MCCTFRNATLVKMRRRNLCRFIRTIRYDITSGDKATLIGKHQESGTPSAAQYAIPFITRRLKCVVRYSFCFLYVLMRHLNRVSAVQTLHKIIWSSGSRRSPSVLAYQPVPFHSFACRTDVSCLCERQTKPPACTSLLL